MAILSDYVEENQKTAKPSPATAPEDQVMSEGKKDEQKPAAIEMASHNNQPLSLRSFLLENDKLEENGTNYSDWIRSLRIVLRQENKLYVLDEPVPAEPAANAARADKEQHKKHVDDSNDVACLMLVTMCKALQKDLEHMEAAFDLAQRLKEMFQVQARQERYDVVKALSACKMQEGQSVGPHVFKMKGYIEHLDRLGYPMSLELATDTILNSLPESYGHFIMYYNMSGMEKNLSELHAMLKTAEKNIKKPSTVNVLMVNKGKGFKKEGKEGKAKVAKPKAKVGRPKSEEGQNDCY